jgi:hypothetical protein
MESLHMTNYDGVLFEDEIGHQSGFTIQDQYQKQNMLWPS